MCVLLLMFSELVLKFVCGMVSLVMFGLLVFLIVMLELCSVWVRLCCRLLLLFMVRWMCCIDVGSVMFWCRWKL